MNLIPRSRNLYIPGVRSTFGEFDELQSRSRNLYIPVRSTLEEFDELEHNRSDEEHVFGFGFAEFD